MKISRKLSRVAIAAASVVLVSPFAFPEVARAGVADARAEVVPAWTPARTDNDVDRFLRCGLSSAATGQPAPMFRTISQASRLSRRLGKTGE